jgi:hypothetical protein
MGWLTMTRAGMGRHDTAKAYLDAQFTYQHTLEDGTVKSLRVLASSCIHNKVWYAALEPSTNGVAEPAFAGVCLVKWNPRDREGYVFGYKDLTEQMGPYEAECPERILDLLGPSDDESALDWRRRCLRNLRRRSRKVEDGMRIRLASPLRFTDGHEGDEFIVRKEGRRISFVDPVTRSRYRISGFDKRKWTLVRETTVHRTVFA